jgi:putative methyltransferase
MRGCPYHCTFCDIGDEYWNKTKWFDLGRIRKEISWMSENRIEFVSVCDSNWGIHPRDCEITQWLIDAKLAHGYPNTVDVTWAKNNVDRVRDIVMLDHRAGSRLFRGVNFSMQSLDATALEKSRRFNLTESVQFDSMRYFREQSIPTYSELIWPMPGETLQSWQVGLQKLIDIGQRDFIQVHPLMLTPNSPMGQPHSVTSLSG